VRVFYTPTRRERQKKGERLGVSSPCKLTLDTSGTHALTPRRAARLYHILHAVEFETPGEGWGEVPWLSPSKNKLPMENRFLLANGAARRKPETETEIVKILFEGNLYVRMVHAL
jgi:hypothetical protein